MRAIKNRKMYSNVRNSRFFFKSRIAGGMLAVGAHCILLNLLLAAAAAALPNSRFQIWVRLRYELLVLLIIPHVRPPFFIGSNFSASNSDSRTVGSLV